MKKLSTIWHQLAFVVVAAATLSSCNRAEYAMLPKTSSYHGTVARQTPDQAPAYQVTRPATVATPEVVETAPQEVATAVAPTPAPVAKPQPAVRPAQKAAAATATAPEAAPAKTAPKMNLMQKAVVQKVMKKADKLASKMQVKQGREASDVSRISGYLRTGLILVLAGILVTLLPGNIFNVIGGILSIVGIVFIILWLLNEL